MNKTKIILDENDIPKKWYNIQADLKTPLDPPLNPQTKNPITPDELKLIFPMELIKQEVSQERYIKIPEEVREIYRLWRPSPLYRARRLEKALKTPAKIYFNSVLKNKNLISSVCWIKVHEMLIDLYFDRASLSGNLSEFWFVIDQLHKLFVDLNENQLMKTNRIWFNKLCSSIFEKLENEFSTPDNVVFKKELTEKISKMKIALQL